MNIFEILDYTGTAVFAISGALAGMRKEFDPFGVIILASVTAIGGGTLRDILIGNTPVGWMENSFYIYIILIACLIAVIFRKYLVYVRKTMFLFDSIGLGLFTITGVQVGQEAGLDPIICIILGTMSASFGGVIRDILSNQVPLIFHREIYASACILGGILFLILHSYGLSNPINSLITSSAVVLVRVLAVKYKWHLPKLYYRV